MRVAVRALWLAPLFAAGAWPSVAAARGAASAETVQQAFDVQIPFAPVLARSGGGQQLVYELHLTNFARDPLTLTGIEVLDAATGDSIGEFRGLELRALLGRPGVDGDKTMVAPGMRAIVYMAVPLTGASAPQRLRHRLQFEKAEPGRAAAAALLGAEIDVDDRPLPILGPPLRGGPWVGVYDPMMERGHRRVVYAVDGRARIPGRFAIDWMRPPNPRGEEMETALGADVLAVADAVVAATRDGVPEPPADAPRDAVALGDATGNYVALDLGDGRYAFYEHLMPGLLVEPGDRVRRGQVIARLGSTGQASRPHLHFHVGDANSPLAAEGLPYLIADFRPIGVYDSIGAFGRGEQWTPVEASDATEPRFPVPNMVVTFSPGNDKLAPISRERRWRRE